MDPRSITESADMDHLTNSLVNRGAECIAQIITQRERYEIGRALVVGCGSGVEAAILSKALGAEVIGIDLLVDFDPTAAKVVQLQKGDATRLEFEDEQFDFVFSYHALEHIPDYRQALAEMRRVLKEGCSYCIGTPNRSRLVGYVGSEKTSISKKIQWNWADWNARFRGRFRNEFGAHAGFTDAELSRCLKEVFGNAEAISLDYYLQLYPRYAGLLRLFSRVGMSRFVFPSVYYVGSKPTGAG